MWVAIDCRSKNWVAVLKSLGSTAIRNVDQAPEQPRSEGLETNFCCNRKTNPGHPAHSHSHYFLSISLFLLECNSEIIIHYHAIVRFLMEQV
jgi:hypothetical protein